MGNSVDLYTDAVKMVFGASFLAIVSPDRLPDFNAISSAALSGCMVCWVMLPLEFRAEHSGSACCYFLAPPFTGFKLFHVETNVDDHIIELSPFSLPRFFICR